MSNAELIRSFSDEELAEWFNRTYCPPPYMKALRPCDNNCRNCWFEWLREAAIDE